MIKDPVPDWLRVILCILSFVSFFPQVRHIWVKKDTTGISPYYILFNLISATEQFTIAFFYLVNYAHDSDFFIHDPRTTGDWLNLIQTLVVWVSSLFLFAECLYFYRSPTVPRIRVVALYVSFLVISVIPTLIDAINPASRDDKRWFGAIFFYVHSTLINPIVTIMSISSLFFQKRDAKALSSTGLAFQAIIFSFVSLSWIARVNFPKLDRLSLNAVIIWYELVGWAAVDNAVFAIVQLVLLCVAKGHPSMRRNPEEEPLLTH